MDAGGHFISKIFPPKNNKFVDFDNISYKIDGKRVFIIAGAFHFYRIHPDEWDFRLKLAKINGLNTIQTYLFWHEHEIDDGVFDFKTLWRNLELFIKKVKEHGFYLILRIGPYSNSERDAGGYPKYLCKKNVKLRVYDEEYLKLVLRYYDKVIDIIKDYTISKGGPIVAIQYENEVLWEESRKYLDILRDYLQERLDDIILIESGMYHQGALTYGDGKKLYHNTELWMGWLYRWGEEPGEAQAAINFRSKIYEGLARGVDGFTYYLFTGGTNFGYTSAYGFPTCYELGEAPLNEMGIPTILFYETKLINYFISSFMEYIADSKAFLNEKGDYDSNLEKGYKFLFSNKEGVKFLFSLEQEGEIDKIFGYNIGMEFSPENPIMVVFNLNINGITFNYIAGNILYKTQDTIVLYNKVGNKVKFEVLGKVFEEHITDDNYKNLIKISYLNKKVSVLILSQNMAYKFYIDKKHNFYITDAILLEENKYLLTPKVDHHINRNPITYQIKNEFKEKLKIEKNLQSFEINISVNNIPEKIELKNPIVKNGAIEVLLDDNFFQKEDRLLLLEEFTDNTTDYGWYRFYIKSNIKQTKTFFFKDIKDQIFIFVNNKFINYSEIPPLFDGKIDSKIPYNFTIILEKGINKIDILLKSWGRYKGYDVGNVTFKEANLCKYFEIDNKLNLEILPTFYHLPGICIEKRESLIDKFSNQTFRNLRIFKFFFDLDFIDTSNIITRLRVYMEKSTLYSGVLFLNGVNIGRYYNKGFEKLRGYYLPAGLLKKKNNSLIIFEETDGDPTNLYIKIFKNSLYS